MQQVFDPARADLSGIDGTHDLYVSDVIHQATIAVDEQGTVASGATAVIVGKASVALNSLYVDRPFLFVIRDDATGAILFLGRVLDPTK
jgi:serpin B